MKIVALTAVAATLASVNANKELMKLKLLSRRAENNYIENLDLRPASVKGAPQECVNGEVVINGEVFPCDNVDFLSFVSAAELNIPEPNSAGDSSDIWGWLSPTGAEITILTLDNGAVLINSTDPVNPCVVAKLPSGRTPSQWGDPKVYQDVLYTIKDRGFAFDLQSTTGVEVYDLTKFDAFDCTEPGFTPGFYEPDHVVSDHGYSHNVIVNTESGRLYTVGAVTCNGGLNIFDLNEDKLRPKFLGCAESDGYTHDAQCVTYTGPDSRYTGREICVAFNEETLTLWDVTDVETVSSDSEMLISRVGYDNQAYTHQGWLTRDMSKVLIDDELDEECNKRFTSICNLMVENPDTLMGFTNTSTYVFDLTDLENPTFESQFIHETISIDHNLYVWGAIHEKGWGGNPPMSVVPDPDYAYLNNYMAGLQIMDIKDNDSSKWKISGFFDINPGENKIEFLGAWSGYYHPSGVYAISSIERGLFFVHPKIPYVDLTTGEQVGVVFPATGAPASPTPRPTINEPTSPPTESTKKERKQGALQGKVEETPVHIDNILLFVAGIIFNVVIGGLVYKKW